MATGGFAAASVGHGIPEVIPWSEPPVEVALLALDGTIVSVNEEWRTFTSANGGDPDRTGVGVSYLDVCSACSDDPVTRRVDDAVRTALGGGLPAPFRTQVPCHAPHAWRWYDVLVSSRFDDDGTCCGATVTLSLSRSAPVLTGDDGNADGFGAPLDPTQADARSTTPAYYQERSERLDDAFARLLMAQAPLGIVVVDDEGAVVLAGRAAEALFGHGPDGLVGMSATDLFPGLGPLHPVHGPAAVGSPGGVRVVDVVRADGSHLPVELRMGNVPLSRGTGVVLLFRVPVAPGPRPGPVADEDRPGDDILVGLDLAVRHIFSSGLTVTGVASSRHGDPDLASTLLGVTRELDVAVREIRSAAFRLHGLDRDSGGTGADGGTGRVGSPEDGAGGTGT